MPSASERLRALAAEQHAHATMTAVHREMTRATMAELQRDELVEALEMIANLGYQPQLTAYQNTERIRRYARVALASVRSDDEIPPGMEGVMQRGC